MGEILRVRGITRQFGGVLALNDVSFSMQEGEIKSIIGPNGAGKTTLFNILTGVTPAQSGEVIFRDRRIETLPAHRRVMQGMARTFQNLQIFGDMSVLDNVVIGRHVHTRSGFVQGWFGTRGARQELRQSRERAAELLTRLGLASRIDAPAAALSYGEAKLLEIARAMAAEPKLLLLDEPMSGLPQDAVSLVSDVITSLNQHGTSLLLVEHNIREVMRLSHSVLVLNNGVPIAEGAPEEVRRDPAVINAYLGEGHA